MSKSKDPPAKRVALSLPLKGDKDASWPLRGEVLPLY
jgi:hypothetical protein